MRHFFPLLLILVSLQACLNKDLKKLELRSELTGYFTITAAELIENDTLAKATLLTNTFQQKLDLAGVSSNSINTTISDLALLGLNIPSDSTFEFFNSMTISLENDTDSIAVAELGEFTDVSSDIISLRVLDGNVTPILLSDDFWVEINYTIEADTLPDGIDFDFYIEWLMTGEL